LNKLKINYETCSDTGVVRSNNEDSFGVFEKEKLFLVCDGMGGHRAGDYASRLAVKTTLEMFDKLEKKALSKITNDLDHEWHIASRLIASIRLANRMIFNRSLTNPKYRGMGTTISGLAFVDGCAISGHVGDSRIYRFRNEKMELLTEDHTWVNELVLDKEIDANQAGKLGNKNVITRALGLERTVKIDFRIDPLQEGDTFLLCTDGITKALPDDEIKRIVLYNKKRLDHTLKHLIDNANMKDGSDNSTAVMLTVENILSSTEKKNLTIATLKAQGRRVSRIEGKLLRKYYPKPSILDNLKNKLRKYLNLS